MPNYIKCVNLCGSYKNINIKYAIIYYILPLQLICGNEDGYLKKKVHNLNIIA